MYQNEPLTKEDAKYLQSLSLNEKWQLSLEKIYQWANAFDSDVYVSFSGGKDSTVLAYLVCQCFAMFNAMPKQVRLVFVNTGLEYPEIRHHAIEYTEWLKKQFPSLDISLQIILPKMRFDKVLKQYGYPVISKEVADTIAYAKFNDDGTPNTYMKKLIGQKVEKDGRKSPYNLERWAFLQNADFKISGSCCRITKKAPAKNYEKRSGEKMIVGTMADESALRMTTWMQHGCNAFEGKRQISKPMSFWVEQDVLHFIVDNNIPIASVYGDIVNTDGENSYHCTGCQRTGCIYCGFGAHLEKGQNRYQRLKETHPKQYAYCIGGGEFDSDGLWKPNKDGLGFARVLDYIGVPY